MQQRHECCNMLLSLFNEDWVSVYLCVCRQFAHWASFTIMVCFPPWQMQQWGKYAFECSFIITIAGLHCPPPADCILFRDQFKSLLKKIIWQNILCKINQAVAIPKTLMFCGRKVFHNADGTSHTLFLCAEIRPLTFQNPSARMLKFACCTRCTNEKTPTAHLHCEVSVIYWNGSLLVGP